MKVAIGYALGLVALATLIAACFKVGSASWINILLLIFGGLLGWICGILTTPLDATEQSQFSTYAAAISTFLSGFVVAKLDRLFQTALDEKAIVTTAAVGSGLIFGSAFLLGALFTFVGRKYWRLP